MEMKKIKICGDWGQDLLNFNDNYRREVLDDIMSNHTSKWNLVNPQSVVQHKNHALKNKRGFIDPDKMPNLIKIKNLIGLDDCQAIILKYNQGETNLYHKDMMPKWDLTRNLNEELPLGIDDYKNNQFVRVLVMLVDRQPGQYMQMGDTMLNNWNKGDTFYYNGKEIFHSAGNCGDCPRMVLRITGTPNEKFNNFVNTKEHFL